ncbi:hypothetical protein J8273_0281 [Carpediemonas membranifera]|uniref:Uncharacterized protein n=1 Tax=Carpediemonas membranifera TaxID=201153 RepID=A0A8J6EAQ1_9EUKA|nr:hypothetical protein J8273_0281 [Carpediemonas membranifera]|eukprot:KAG9395065.1 hypothetical protein J8273_0281 [Carpediemonas membranifera]
MLTRLVARIEQSQAAQCVESVIEVSSDDEGSSCSAGPVLLVGPEIKRHWPSLAAALSSLPIELRSSTSGLRLELSSGSVAFAIPPLLPIPDADRVVAILTDSTALPDTAAELLLGGVADVRFVGVPAEAAAIVASYTRDRSSRPARASVGRGAEGMLSVIPGVGPTTAASLLSTHGSVAGVGRACPELGLGGSKSK